MAEKNRWHPVMLPDDYIRKMKQDIGEIKAEAEVEAKTRYEPDPDFSPPPEDVPSA